jgi:signal transduction histidine kinase
LALTQKKTQQVTSFEEKPSPLKVLVVEPNELVLKVIGIRLKSKGVESVSLANPQEVSKFLAQEKFDLAILNLYFPDTSGLEALREIRSRFTPVELPVIMMSEKSDEESLIASLDLGANDFLTKPLNFTLSWARIHTLVMIKRYYESIEKGRREILKNASMKILLEMVRSLTHEINNPLTIIQGKIEKIKMGFNPSPPLLLELQKMEDSVDQTTKFLEALEIFSQVDPPLSPVRFSDLMEKVKLICQGALLSEGIGLRITEKEKGIVLKAKESKLIQVFFNLINNSRREVANRPGAYIEFQITKKNGQTAVISFTDSGTGIAPEIWDRIFDPYFTTHRGKSSLGMGLPLARELVEEFGGKINLNKDAPNTQFLITLPIWEA